MLPQSTSSTISSQPQTTRIILSPNNKAFIIHSKIQKQLGQLISNDDPSSLFIFGTLLGKGSFGYVYYATNVKTNAVVAIKIISLREEAAMEDVIHEISALKDCVDNHIVEYYGCYLLIESLWIVMEYCAGGSVCDILKIRGKPLTEDQIALICKAVLKGLNYIHHIGKVHRDIKGGNILLTSTGKAKLADFGVSAKLQGTFQKRNTFAGTPYWMAPEVILENDYDGRADIWSLGITAIEMAEINPPHADIHPWRVLFLIPKEQPPVLADKKKWSACFHEFLSFCLRKQLNTRPSAEELLRHSFVQNCKSKSVLIQLVDECQKIINQRGSGLFEDYDEGLMPITDDPQNEELKIMNPKKPKKRKPQRAGFSDLHNLCQDNSVQLPWLNLNYINPLSIITPMENDQLSTLIPKLSHEPNLQISNLANTISSNPYLGNLFKTFNYHQHKQETLPMNPKQLDDNVRVVNELSATIKTILRI